MRRLMTFDRPIPGEEVLNWMESLNKTRGRSELWELVSDPSAKPRNDDGAYPVYRVHLRDKDGRVIRPDGSYGALLVFSANNDEPFVTRTSFAMQGIRDMGLRQNPPNRKKTTVA